jgi:hypothetical protein
VTSEGIRWYRADGCAVRRIDAITRKTLRVDLQCRVRAKGATTIHPVRRVLVLDGDRLLDVSAESGGAVTYARSTSE